MIVSLINKSSIASIALPEKIRGQYVITNNDRVSVEIEGLNDKWIIKSSKRVKILDHARQQVTSCALKEMSIYGLKILDHATSNTYLFVEPTTDDRAEFKKYLVCGNTDITIGRKKESNICIDNKYISKDHTVLQCRDEKWSVTDCNSSNGTFVNGSKITKAQLSVGDVVYIMGTMIVIGDRMLAINNPDQTVTIKHSLIIPYIPQRFEAIDEDNFDYETVEKHSFYRSPRFKRDIERAVFKIDAPPNSPVGDELPIMMTIGPSMTMGMASMATAVYGVAQGNIMSAVTSGCMLLGTVLWPIFSKKYEKKHRNQKEALRQSKYKEYLGRIQESFEAEKQKQKQILLENNVGINTCIERITNVSRNLWDRAYGQNDFLQVTVGEGDLPLNADIQYPERKFEIERDQLEEDLLKICEAPQMLHNVPVTVSLFDNTVTGVIGNREKALHFANGIILQLATFYSYDEVKFIFLYDEKMEASALQYVKWLPHIWNNDKSIRFLIKNNSDIKDVAAYLKAEFEGRSTYKDDDLDNANPYYIIFSFSKALALRTEVIQNICECKRNLHFSIITFYDELKNLPKECSNVIELDGDTGKIYNKNDITGRSVSFKPNIYIDAGLEKYSTMLSNIHLNTGETSFVLPKMLTFLDMFHVGKIEHLNVLTRWKDNDPTKSLEVPVGVDTIGDPFKLDLHEKYHGPHGLVAGMTGSGKSEFIMTYILSLAVNYHPDEVAFVLIDYKGGGMAKAFENLPHTAGIITNLDGASINRSLISIQSELRRRQSIFAKASKDFGVSNVDIYKYQKMYREGLVQEPLQHLFIISDEFAELKMQQPEFMAQLVSAARIGRSLGVHLILATQKPSGVVDDQIWSNAKFKACLKVQDKADSMDMLKRPEAAELQDTGRFYLQVGYNELFKLGQSAWSGAAYYPSDRVEQHVDNSVDVIDDVGRVMKSAKIDKRNAVAEPKKQIDAITDYLADLAEQEHIRVRPLWLEPIPAVIVLKNLQEKYGYMKSFDTIEAIVGEYDDPMNQRQELLTLSFSESGNVAVYGASGSGKTTFLTTLLYSLISTHEPEELNIYILDFSAETLTAFSRAPHVGDVVLAQEREKVSNLLKLLLGQIETRKKLLADFGGSIVAYNASAAQILPSIVVAINNYAAFSELYDDYEDEMLFLTREGVKYGIYFVLTATATNSVRYKMLQNIGQSFVLQMTDDTDYTAILGKTDGLIPSKIKGRGLCKLDDIYEFQTAYALQSENILSDIRTYCQLLNESSEYRARKIPVLPHHVNMAFIEPYVQKNSVNIPVGVETESLDISYLKLSKNFITFIESNGDFYVHTLSALVNLISNYAHIETRVFDVDTALNQHDNAEYYCTKNSIGNGIDAIFDIVLQRHNEMKEAIDSEQKLPVYPMLTVVISSLAQLREYLSEEQNEKMNLILEKGSCKLNMFIVIGESSKALATYNFERWYKNNASQNDGVWVGSGIADQYYLKLSKTTSEMNAELTQQFGFVVNGAKAIKVKLLTEGDAE